MAFPLSLREKFELDSTGNGQEDFPVGGQSYQTVHVHVIIFPFLFLFL